MKSCSGRLAANAHRFRSFRCVPFSKTGGLADVVRALRSMARSDIKSACTFPAIARPSSVTLKPWCVASPSHSMTSIAFAQWSLRAAVAASILFCGIPGLLRERALRGSAATIVNANDFICLRAPCSKHRKFSACRTCFIATTGNRPFCR